MAMETIVCTITPGLNRLLQKHSDQTQLTKSDLVRRALEDYFKNTDAAMHDGTGVTPAAK